MKTKWGSGIKNPDQPRLVYFAPVKHLSYAQRPHFMVKAFMDAGFKILWIDPYPTRLPMLADFRRLQKSTVPPPPPTDTRISVIHPFALPMEPIFFSGVINHVVAWQRPIGEIKKFSQQGATALAVGKPSKMADWVLKNIVFDHAFIDVMDEFSAFYDGISRKSARTRLRSILKKVDHVYCSASRLMLDIYRERPDACFIPNGYSTANLPAPADAQTRRCIGYVGSIASWFDWPLVQALAHALPDVPIRLIGPELVARPPHLPPNIEFTGELPLEKAMEMMKEFAIGLIPFRLNELTAGVDPIKFYEYKSMGIPIWTTAFGEMTYRDHLPDIHFITPHCDWRTLWSHTVASPVNAADALAFRQDVNWNRRFESVVAQTLKSLKNNGPFPAPSLP